MAIVHSFEDCNKSKQYFITPTASIYYYLIRDGLNPLRRELGERLKNGSSVDMLKN